MRALAALCILLAGCSGTMPATVGGVDAAHAADDAASQAYEYALFLGITGTEGALNWTAYEAALREADSPGDQIAAAFDQDRDHGAWGDGQLGSWLSTHFIYDQEHQLMGGLYTQTTRDGTETAFASFRGPYAGTTALPNLMLPMRTPPAEQVVCGLVSSMDQWHIDSGEAARIALGRPVMQEHIQSMPGGELTYYYFPGLDVTPDCPAELDTPSNYWVISHTDVDAFLIGEHPTMVTVTIDAADGTVLNETVGTFGEIAPVVTEFTLQGASMLPLTETVVSAEWSVEAEARTLDLWLRRIEAPTQHQDAEVRIYDPAGTLQARHPVQAGPIPLQIPDPAAGTWRLEYAFVDTVPGDHALDVRATLRY